MTKYRAGDVVRSVYYNVLVKIDEILKSESYCLATAITECVNKNLGYCIVGTQYTWVFTDFCACAPRRDLRRFTKTKTKAPVHGY
jgi:hypothetical protein